MLQWSMLQWTNKTHCMHMSSRLFEPTNIYAEFVQELGLFKLSEIKMGGTGRRICSFHAAPGDWWQLGKLEGACLIIT